METKSKYFDGHGRLSQSEESELLSLLLFSIPRKVKVDKEDEISHHCLLFWNYYFHFKCHLTIIPYFVTRIICRIIP